MASSVCLNANNQLSISNSLKNCTDTEYEDPTESEDPNWNDILPNGVCTDESKPIKKKNLEKSSDDFDAATNLKNEAAKNVSENNLDILEFSKIDKDWNLPDVTKTSNGSEEDLHCEKNLEEKNKDNETFSEIISVEENDESNEGCREIDKSSGRESLKLSGFENSAFVPESCVEYLDKTATIGGISPSAPLVIDLPKISYTLSEKNSNTARLTEIRIESIQKADLPVDDRPRSEQLIGGGVFKDCEDILFGTNIVTPGDVVLNQYVDLRDGVPPQITIQKEDSSPSKSCTSNAVILWISLIVCAVLVGGTVAAVVTSGHEDGTDPADEIDWDIDASKDYIMRLVKRGQWSVHSDIKVDDQSVKPAKMVIILHTADKFCGNTTMCENRVCSIEAWHIQIGYGTIGYSFLIGGDGRIYEGRGWGKQGAFALGFNCASVGIAFIGNYDNDELTDTMIEAYNILVTEGVRRHAIDESYKMFGHYQVKENGTRSPGANIKKIFTSWPHWTAVVTDDDKLCADSS